MQVSYWEHDAVEAGTFWTSKAGEEWWVEFQLVELEGRVECVAMTLMAPPDQARPLDARLVKEFPFASVLLRARRETPRILRWMRDVWEAASKEPRQAGKPGVRVSPGALAAWEEHAQFVELEPGRKSVRRSRYSQADLERAARVYADAYWAAEPGKVPTPTRAVREDFGLTANEAASLVRQCRRRGLIGKTKNGFAGGALPPADREEDA